MKMQFVKVITNGLLSAMLLVTLVASAQGQSHTQILKANIPFDFSVGEKKLPAGTYLFSRAMQNSGDIVLAITDADGRLKAMRLSNSTQRLRASDKATVVFHHFGDQYFLFQVWRAGETTGREFPKSRSEREIRRNLAVHGKMPTSAKGETVTIVGVLQ